MCTTQHNVFSGDRSHLGSFACAITDTQPHTLMVAPVCYAHRTRSRSSGRIASPSLSLWLSFLSSSRSLSSFSLLLLLSVSHTTTDSPAQALTFNTHTPLLKHGATTYSVTGGNRTAHLGSPIAPRQISSDLRLRQARSLAMPLLPPAELLSASSALVLLVLLAAAALFLRARRNASSVPAGCCGAVGCVRCVRYAAVAAAAAERLATDKTPCSPALRAAITAGHTRPHRYATPFRCTPSVTTRMGKTKRGGKKRRSRRQDGII